MQHLYSVSLPALALFRKCPLHSTQVRSVREGPLAVFLARLLRLLDDIETLLPQFCGLALTLEQLSGASARTSTSSSGSGSVSASGSSSGSSSSSASGSISDPGVALLAADTQRVGRELDAAFARLRACVKQLTTVRLADELPTLRRVVATASAYVVSFFQDKFISFKQMRAKVELCGIAQ